MQAAMSFERAQLPGSYILELVDVLDRAFVYRDPPSGRQVSLYFAEVPCEVQRLIFLAKNGKIIQVAFQGRRRAEWSDVTTEIVTSDQ